MKWRDQAMILVEKARQDLYVMQSLQGDSKVSDEAWGFHAQQAVEKLLKALLSLYQVEYPFTHVLTRLADLLARFR